jgi:predicted acetyltransferase
MDYEMRPVTEKEFPDFMRACETAFSEDIKDEDIERSSRVHQLERTLAVFDEGNVVATAGAYSFVMTVPGGEVPAAGVTFVGVLPSHRRKAILSSMMKRQLEDSRKLEEPVAILWASEGAIYTKFGYGLASLHAAINVERHQTSFRDDSPQVGRARLLTEDEALKVIPDVYERVRIETPGMYARDQTWWENHTLPDPEHWREGAGPMFRAVIEIDGRAEAYTLYRVRSSWGDDGIHDGTLEVIEAMATSPVATRELWGYLFGVDLVDRIKSFTMPVDHPLKFMLKDMRRLRMNVRDSLWLRVVDVAGALEGRSYRAKGKLVFELADAFCPWNAGTWELDVSTEGTRVTRTDAEPGLRMTIEELGAVYLGATTWAELLHAGRIEELQDGAVALADDLFTTDRAPWCPEIF